MDRRSFLGLSSLLLFKTVSIQSNDIVPLDLSTLSSNEFWKILCDKNHPQHTEATEYFAKVLSEPLYPRGMQSDNIISCESIHKLQKIILKNKCGGKITMYWNWK